MSTTEQIHDIARIAAVTAQTIVCQKKGVTPEAAAAAVVAAYLGSVTALSSGTPPAPLKYSPAV